MKVQGKGVEMLLVSHLGTSRVMTVRRSEFVGEGADLGGNPMSTYGCESWTVKRAEHRRIDAFELCC